MSVSYDEKSSPPISAPKTDVPPTTNTFRLLRLRSNLADRHISPTSKMWIIPPFTTSPGVQFKISIRSMRIFNAFRNIPKPRNLVLQSTIPGYSEVYSIPPGNYTGQQLAEYLSLMLTTARTYPSATRCTMVAYDPTNCQMMFSPSLQIGRGNTQYRNEVWTEIGIPVPNFNTGYGFEVFDTEFDKSPIPVDLSGVSGIAVHSDLSMNNIPISGFLGYLPMDVAYGDLFAYQETVGIHRLCMNNEIRSITITLKDQEDRDLSDRYIYTGLDLASSEQYDTSSYGQYAHDNFFPTWEIVLAIEVVPFNGYQAAMFNQGVEVHQV